MGPETLGEGQSSHQQDRDYASRRRHTHLPAEPVFCAKPACATATSGALRPRGLAFGTERQAKQPEKSCVSWYVGF